MDRDDWHLLKRYYDGDCSADVLTPSQAIFTTRAGRAVLGLLLKAADDRHGLSELPDAAAAYERFERAVDEPSRATRSSSSPLLVHGAANRPLRSLGSRPAALSAARRWSAWAVAGAVAIIAGATGVWYRQHAASPASGPRAEPGAEYATTVGQRATITLRDGTRVQLAPASHLRIDDGYGADTRHVVIDGEAELDVAAMPGVPFTVHAGNTVTRVLGTRFTVRHYAGDIGVRVAVTNGKVVVTGTTARRPSLTLTAGAVGEVTDSLARAMTAADLDEVTGWTSGHLVFRDTPIAEVLQTLGRWYGYTFVLADSASLGNKVTVRLDTQVSSAALSSLKLVLNMDMTFNGNVVTLSPRRAASQRERQAPVLSSPSPEVGR